MKFAMFGTILALAVASLAWGDSGPADEFFAPAPAAGPTTRESKPTTRPARPTMLGSRRQLRFPAIAVIGPRLPLLRPATPQEIDEMLDFMSQYSRARYRVLSELNLPPTSPVLVDAINKWRNYTLTKDHFPAVADMMLQRFELEDDLFSLTLTAQQEGGSSAEPVIREKIHDKVKKIVDTEFAERQARIERLETLLNEEKGKLAADQASEDKVVDQRTNGIMNRLERLNRSLVPPTTRPNPQSASQPNPTAQNANTQNGAGQDGNHDPVVNTSNGGNSQNNSPNNNQ
jgi:hypothetical protein